MPYSNVFSNLPYLLICSELIFSHQCSMLEATAARHMRLSISFPPVCGVFLLQSYHPHPSCHIVYDTMPPFPMRRLPAAQRLLPTRLRLEPIPKGRAELPSLSFAGICSFFFLFLFDMVSYTAHSFCSQNKNAEVLEPFCHTEERSPQYGFCRCRYWQQHLCKRHYVEWYATEKDYCSGTKRQRL